MILDVTRLYTSTRGLWLLVMEFSNRVWGVSAAQRCTPAQRRAGVARRKGEEVARDFFGGHPPTAGGAKTPAAGPCAARGLALNLTSRWGAA